MRLGDIFLSRQQRNLEYCSEYLQLVKDNLAEVYEPVRLSLTRKYTFHPTIGSVDDFLNSACLKLLKHMQELSSAIKLKYLNTEQIKSYISKALINLSYQLYISEYRKFKRRLQLTNEYQHELIPESNHCIWKSEINITLAFIPDDESIIISMMLDGYLVKEIKEKLGLNNYSFYQIKKAIYEKYN